MRVLVVALDCTERSLSPTYTSIGVGLLGLLLVHLNLILFILGSNVTSPFPPSNTLAKMVLLGPAWFLNTLPVVIDRNTDNAGSPSGPCSPAAKFSRSIAGPVSIIYSLGVATENIQSILCPPVSLYAGVQPVTMLS